MNETTSRLALPLLTPGQAQKEMTHNEALATLDLVTAASVLSAELSTPPSAPVVGACWLVGAGATGDWAGRSGAIAGWTEAGWRFVAPRTGMLAWVEDRGCFARYVDAEGWRLGAPLGDPRPAIPSPAGGTTVDGEARATLILILALLQYFGLLSEA